MTCLIWLIAVTSIVYVVTESVIGAFMRYAVAGWGPLWTVFIYCRVCFGFWVGVATSRLFPGVVEPTWATPLVSGGAAMMLCYVWNQFAPNVAYANEQGANVQEEEE